MDISIDALTASASDTIRDLAGVIGMSGEEVAEVLSSVDSEVRALLRGEVSAQEQRKRALEERECSAVRDIRRIAGTLREVEDANEHLSELADEAEKQQMSLLQRVACIEEMLLQLDQKRDLRYNVIDGFLSKVAEMYGRLRMEVPEQYREVGDDLSAERLSDCQSKEEELTNEVEARTEKVAFLVAGISNLWKELHVPVEECTSEFDRIILQSEHGEIGVHDEAIATLEARQQGLEEEKTARQKEIDSLTKDILALWERLEVPTEERKAMIVEVKQDALAKSTIAKYYDFRADLQERKKARMEELVKSVRLEIDEVCEEMKMTEAQVRDEFPAAFDDSAFTDEVLDAHEQYLATLRERAEQYAGLLKMVDRREDYLQQLAEYEVSRKDPTRLMGAKAYLVRKREEGMERIKKRGLPSLEAKLLAAIGAFEEELEMPFLIHGKPYADAIRAQQTERNARSSKPVSKVAQSIRSSSSSNAEEPTTPKSSRKSRGSRTDRPDRRQLRPRSGARRSVPRTPGGDPPRSRRGSKQAVSKKPRAATTTKQGRRRAGAGRPRPSKATGPAMVPRQRSQSSDDEDTEEHLEMVVRELASEANADYTAQRVASSIDQGAGMLDLSDVAGDLMSGLACAGDGQLVVGDKQYHGSIPPVALEAKKAFQRGQFQEALKLYNQAIANAGPDDDICTVYHGRSKVYTELGMFEEALQDSDKALELNAQEYDGMDWGENAGALANA